MSGERGQHVLLVGAMGSGKTTVGERLADVIARPFFDSDAELRLEREGGAAAILATDGRDALHHAELAALHARRAERPSVVAVAAGVVDLPGASATLSACGSVVYLRASAATQRARVGDGAGRPIGGDVAATLARLDAPRRAHYEEIADLVVDVDDAAPDEVVRVIVQALRREVTVELGDRSYRVSVGPGVRAELAAALPATARRAAIVTQAGIGYAPDPGVDSATFTIGDGEAAKSLTTIERLCRSFSQFGLTRADVVVAVGGGVVTDVAGFAASCYHRGVALVNVPTTLLGQVDAAIGGKTGVNLPEGKNLVGAFWQPTAVLCDTDTLATLPEREGRSGLGEMAKYAFLGVEDLDRLPLVDQVTRCVALKAEVVCADEREGDRRMILNYGHTLAHALEAAGFADGPGRGGIDLRHGEAVAIGLVFAARLAYLLGRIDEGRVARHLEVVRAYGLPEEIPSGIDPDELITSMGRDKKATAGLTFVLDGPAGVEPVREVPIATVLAALEASTSRSGAGAGVR